MSSPTDESRRYAFFAHRECEFFPCHAGADPENFNCLFCFCPLYVLGTRCGGACVLLEDGSKDCSRCLYPHLREHYDDIMARLGAWPRPETHPLDAGPDTA